MKLKVCIIGAGSSGLATAKILHENSIAFDWFEISSGIGGNWRYNNDNGRSAAYDTLHIDASKERMAFSDFPMPAAFPNYPHHSQVLEYFKNFAENFGLISLVTFRTSVNRVKPLSKTVTKLPPRIYILALRKQKPIPPFLYATVTIGALKCLISREISMVKLCIHVIIVTLIATKTKTF